MSFNLAHFLYEEDTIGIFLLVTIVMGGGAAVLAGRAIAATWRPWWHVGGYMLILGVAVRFIHFALFDETLLTLHYYLVDTAFCIFFGYVGFRMTRARQMVSQYGWLYAAAGPFGWAEQRSAPGEGGEF
jgi:small-conductance mechanosensitive channel